MKTPSDVTQSPPRSNIPATDERYLHTQPPPIDPAVWRTEIPLIVAERCNSPHLLAVWFALRWLMAAFPQSRGFGTRIIAQRARVSHKYVTGWVAELIEHGLVEVIGEEPMRNLAPRPIYTIPLHRLEAMSNAMAVDVLMNYGVKHLPSPPPSNPDQLPLAMDTTVDRTGDTQQPEHHHKSEPGYTDPATGYANNITAEITREHLSGDISPPGSVVTREHFSGDISPPGSDDMKHQRNSRETHTDQVPQRDQTPGDIRDQTSDKISSLSPGDIYPTESVVIREQTKNSSPATPVVPQEQKSEDIQEQKSEDMCSHDQQRDQKEQTSVDQKAQVSLAYTQKEQTYDPNREQNLVDNREHIYHACMHGTGQDPEHGRDGRANSNYLHKVETGKDQEPTTVPEHEITPETPAHSATNKYHPPPVPQGEYALPLHPFDLWRNACPHVRPLDYAHIEALAAEHDLVTDGYGMYWVGRAILSATLASDARYLKVIKVVLDRWRNEGTYGSEAPWEQHRREQRKEQYNGATPSSRENSQSRRATARKSRQSGRVEASRVTITDEDLTRFLRTQSSDVHGSST